MRHGVWILAGVLFMAAVAAAPASISLGGSVSLPTVGMRFRVFREMKPMPLPLPAIVAKRRSDGVNLVDSLEYWRFRQTAGVWFNDVGEIRVGTLLFPPLAEAQLKSEGELATELEPLDAELPEEQLKQWVRDFTGIGVSGVKPFP